MNEAERLENMLKLLDRISEVVEAIQGFRSDASQFQPDDSEYAATVFEMNIEYQHLEWLLGLLQQLTTQ